LDQKSVDKKKRIISQYKQVFSTKEGKAVLYDLMKGNFMISSTPHVPGDPYSTAVNIGRSEVVKNILHILKIDPEAFLKLEEQEQSHV
jgi:hypothetical protein